MSTSTRPADAPGRWHHVTTRALSRRAYFEHEEDYDFMLRLLAQRAAEERWEIHSHSLMSNHLHLLVCSLDGRLPDTMRDVLSPFTKWFNGRRDRDGPLVTSRYFSRVVEGSQDRFTVTRYIDQNPIKANLVRSVVDYPHGSAYSYSRSRGPQWLTRSDVEDAVKTVTGEPTYDPRLYAKVFDPPLPATLDWVVEERLKPGAEASGTLERLMEAPPNEVASWLTDAARLADGTGVGCILAHPDAIVAAVERLRVSDPRWTCVPVGRPRRAWPILTAGLLRQASRLRPAQIAARLRLSPGSTGRLQRDHRILMLADPLYAARASALLHREMKALAVGPFLRRRFFFPAGKLSRGEDASSSR